MTTVSHTPVPNVVRTMEGAEDAKLGVRYVQFGPYGNSNVTKSTVEGWDDAGVLDGDIDYNPISEEYVASGGVPEVDLGVVETSIKGSFTVTLMYPEHYVIALAKGQALIVTYPGSPVNTTVDTGSGSITSTTIPVASGAGANYSAGDLLEIVVGDATYGTRSLFRRVKSISSDVITLKKPLGRLPANGAAVKKVTAISYKVSTAPLSDVLQFRVLENDNGNETVDIEHKPKVQVKRGKYLPGAGKEPPKVELNIHMLGEYNSSSGDYDVSERYELA